MSGTLPGGARRTSRTAQSPVGKSPLSRCRDNGLVREYLPKGTEITGDIDYLWAVADSLNDRPRAIPGFRKPIEVFAELLLQETEIAPA
jgi:hypothetical protein